MKTIHALALALCGLMPNCSRESSPSPSGSAAAAPSAPSATGASLGNVMVQVARRFEIAGKAAAANRFELAEFEAGEIGELFEADVSRAELPREGPTVQIRPMAKAFLETSAPELKKAAATKDRAAFAASFARAAAACNACHQASEKAFIQVPSVPGRSVPDLDPAPTSPGSSRAPG